MTFIVSVTPTHGDIILNFSIIITITIIITISINTKV